MQHVNTTAVCASALNKFYLLIHIEMRNFLPVPRPWHKWRSSGKDKLHVCDFHRLQVYSASLDPACPTSHISVGHQWRIRGELGSLSAGIRAYLSQIVKLSSRMSIYALASTWLSYFNDFICQSLGLRTLSVGAYTQFFHSN